MRHRHQWTEVARTYTPGVESCDGFRARGPDAVRSMQAMVLGLTVIELRCSDCGDLTHRSVAGRAFQGQRESGSEDDWSEATEHLAVEDHPFNDSFDGSCKDCGDFPGEGVHVALDEKRRGRAWELK